MKNKFILLIITILLLSPALSRADQKVFTHTVRYVMGENESRQELRELATLEAKRQVLEQVGVYIEAETELKQYIKETETTFQDESDYNKEILAITAGVTKTEIASEEWKEENEVFVLYLTCKITVDTEDVNRKIQELVRDRQKLDDMKMLQNEVARLQSEMEELRQRLEQAEASQVEEIKQQRSRLSDDLSATEWFDKGLVTDNLTDQDATHAPRWVDFPEEEITVEEGGLVEFTIAGMHPDNLLMEIIYYSENIPEKALSFIDHGDGTATFSWQTAIGDEGVYTAYFILSDADTSIDGDVQIVVGGAARPSQWIDVPDEITRDKNMNGPSHGFNLIAPTIGSELDSKNVTLSWQAAEDVDPSDNVIYTVVIARDAAFTTSLCTFRDIGKLEFKVPMNQIGTGGKLFWKVSASDKKSTVVWGSESNVKPWYFTVKLQTPPPGP